MLISFACSLTCDFRSTQTTAAAHCLCSAPLYRPFLPSSPCWSLYWSPGLCPYLCAAGSCHSLRNPSKDLGGLHSEHSSRSHMPKLSRGQQSCVIRLRFFFSWNLSLLSPLFQAQQPQWGSSGGHLWAFAFMIPLSEITFSLCMMVEERWRQ